MALILRSMTAQTAFLDPLGPLDEPRGGPAWRFEVAGEAVPQGSWKAFIDRRNGKARAKPDNETELTRWRKAVERTALAALPPWLTGPEGEPIPIDGPVFISLIVCRARNPSDYLVDGRTLRKGARRFPDTAPDSDKLERAIFDALTGIAFVNDGRIVTNVTVQRYCGLDDEPRVIIEVVPL